MTEKPTVRQSIGRPIAGAGQNIGKMGTVVVMTAGISVFTLPLVFPGIVILLMAVPIYYGGCAIAGDKAEKGPFDP